MRVSRLFGKLWRLVPGDRAGESHPALTMALDTLHLAAFKASLVIVSSFCGVSIAHFFLNFSRQYVHFMLVLLDTVRS